MEYIWALLLLHSCSKDASLWQGCRTALCRRLCTRSLQSHPFAVQAGQGLSGKKAAPGNQAAPKKEAGTTSNKNSPGSGLQRALAGAVTSETKPPQQDAAHVASPNAPEEQQAVSLVSAAAASDTVPLPVAASATTTPARPIAISSRSHAPAGRCDSGSDVAGTSAEGAWGSTNSGSGWASYRQGKKKAALGPDPGALGKSPGSMSKSPGSEAGAGSSKAGRRARRNAKKAAADAKADVYAY